jgi:hypothetical protein
VRAIVAPPQERVSSPPGLLERYDAFVLALDCGAQAKRLRRRAVRSCLDGHPDLAAWMTRPTDARLRDIRRCSAWPFLAWCFIEDVVVPTLTCWARRPRASTHRPHSLDDDHDGRLIGRGFRNFANYRLRLLPHCGGVDWQDQPAARLRGRSPRLVA